MGAAVAAVLTGDAVVDLEGGRRYARRFDPATIAAEYFTAYAALLGGRTDEQAVAGCRPGRWPRGSP